MYLWWQAVQVILPGFLLSQLPYVDVPLKLQASLPGFQSSNSVSDKKIFKTIYYNFAKFLHLARVQSCWADGAAQILKFNRLCITVKTEFSSNPMYNLLLCNCPPAFFSSKASFPSLSFLTLRSSWSTSLIITVSSPSLCTPSSDLGWAFFKLIEYVRYGRFDTRYSSRWWKVRYLGIRQLSDPISYSLSWTFKYPTRPKVLLQ